MESGSSHATHIHITVRFADPNPSKDWPLFTRVTIEKDKIEKGGSQVFSARALRSGWPSACGVAGLRHANKQRVIFMRALR